MPSYSCWPTAKTFNFVSNLLVDTKHLDVIHEVYTSAGRLGFEIDACCLNIMIKGLCKNGDVDAALQVFDEIPKQGCEPNTGTFSALTHGLFEVGHVVVGEHLECSIEDYEFNTTDCHPRRWFQVSANI
ncbi:hypothetical protein L1987_26727 [Smallanthus sonchifolius]|uniref:Uncharacterized protein n=1 Tax=Smallanthus sonchifolius TaxID=185202 RepID=A0ACB9IB15_9ASTR|nr:hypothetical protein L1987_26727 [Smallanthus sonchifolius]